MTDRNRSIVPQGRRDVAPSRSVVPAPQHAPDIVRQPPTSEARHDVTRAPDLKWRYVPREERRHTAMVPADRREVEARAWDDDRHQLPDVRHYVEEHYPDAYDYRQPVRYRHRVNSDASNVSINVNIENRSETGRGSESLSDAAAMWIGGGFVAAAFIIGLFLAVALHH